MKAIKLVVLGLGFSGTYVYIYRLSSKKGTRKKWKAFKCSVRIYSQIVFGLQFPGVQPYSNHFNSTPREIILKRAFASKEFQACPDSFNFWIKQVISQSDIVSKALEGEFSDDIFNPALKEASVSKENILFMDESQLKNFELKQSDLFQVAAGEKIFRLANTLPNDRSLLSMLLEVPRGGFTGDDSNNGSGWSTALKTGAVAVIILASRVPETSAFSNPLKSVAKYLEPAVLSHWLLRPKLVQSPTGRGAVQGPSGYIDPDPQNVKNPADPGPRIPPVGGNPDKPGGGGGNNPDYGQGKPEIPNRIKRQPKSPSSKKYEEFPSNKKRQRRKQLDECSVEIPIEVIVEGPDKTTEIERREKPSKPISIIGTKENLENNEIDENQESVIQAKKLLESENINPELKQEILESFIDTKYTKNNYPDRIERAIAYGPNKENAILIRSHQGRNKIVHGDDFFKGNMPGNHKFNRTYYNDLINTSQRSVEQNYIHNRTIIPDETVSAFIDKVQEIIVAPDTRKFYDRIYNETVFANHRLEGMVRTKPTGQEHVEQFVTGHPNSVDELIRIEQRNQVPSSTAMPDRDKKL